MVQNPYLCVLVSASGEAIPDTMMRKYPILLLAALLSAACGGTAARTGRTAAKDTASTASATTAEPVEYTYRVKAVHPHSTTAYTQGLQYANGYLWEGTGQYGESVVRRVEIETGEGEVLFSLPRSEFGEGLTLLDGRLYQLTWQSNTAHVYDLATRRKIRDHRYAGEGWGLTTDGEKLYMSDGTASIRTIDPETFRRERTTTVTYKGEPVQFLNELEWIEGKIWANVYTSDRIAIIDPRTGVVEGVVDLSGLLPEEEVTPSTDVLNGIAYDPATKRIFVTGKNWSKLFEIEIIRK